MYNLLCDLPFIDAHFSVLYIRQRESALHFEVCFIKPKVYEPVNREMITWNSK